MKQAEMSFDGPDVSAADAVRLGTQLELVARLLRSGNWLGLAALARFTGGSEAGVSARIRDLRKARHGGFTIERTRLVESDGLWLYRVAPGDLAAFRERWS